MIKFTKLPVVKTAPIVGPVPTPPVFTKPTVGILPLPWELGPPGAELVPVSLVGVHAPELTLGLAPFHG